MYQCYQTMYAQYRASSYYSGKSDRENNIMAFFSLKQRKNLSILLVLTFVVFVLASLVTVFINEPATEIVRYLFFGVITSLIYRQLNFEKEDNWTTLAEIISVISILLFWLAFVYGFLIGLNSVVS